MECSGGKHRPSPYGPLSRLQVLPKLPVHGDTVTHDPDGIGRSAEVRSPTGCEHHWVGRDRRVRRVVLAVFAAESRREAKRGRRYRS